MCIRDRTKSAAGSFLTKQDYDLIVLEVNLPDGNVFDFCREVKERRPDTAIISVSYTHLNIIQGVTSTIMQTAGFGSTEAVSYTHLDVYKRQLLGRGIDKEIIQFCLESGRVYESAFHHNVVFVGMRCV